MMAAISIEQRSVVIRLARTALAAVVVVLSTAAQTGASSQPGTTNHRLPSAYVIEDSEVSSQAALKGALERRGELVAAGREASQAANAVAPRQAHGAEVPADRPVAAVAGTGEQQANAPAGPPATAAASVLASIEALPAAGVAPPQLSIMGQALSQSVNETRASFGLRGTTGDPMLHAVAQARADDMARRRYFSHYTPEGTTVFDLMNQWDVRRRAAGEILAQATQGTHDVGEVMRAFMDSPPHRTVILRPYYSHLGVGVADDGAGLRYLVVVFITE